MVSRIWAAYVDALIAARKRVDDRPDDLVTRLMTTEVDGQRLSDVEVRTQLVFLIVSGNETTRHLISNLLATLATRPDVFAALKADRSLVERAVEESLRYQPPIHLLLRNVMEQTDVFGRNMCPGEKIVFGIASANRDEHVYEHADEFRLDRARLPDDHLSFGAGPHLCLGNHLTRLIGRVVLEEMLAVFGAGSLAFAEGYERCLVPMFLEYGPETLDVEIVPPS